MPADRGIAIITTSPSDSQHNASCPFFVQQLQQKSCNNCCSCSCTFTVLNMIFLSSTKWLNKKFYFSIITSNKQSGVPNLFVLSGHARWAPVLIHVTARVLDFLMDDLKAPSTLRSKDCGGGYQSILCSAPWQRSSSMTSPPFRRQG